MEDIVNKETLAGFDLCGYVQEDNRILLKNKTIIDEWPEEITHCGNTYTLEYVEKCGKTPEGVFCNAVYV